MNQLISVLWSLWPALDARDRYTAGHSHRVSQLSCAVATAQEMDTRDVERIRIGAQLHDIGKIGIADAVLQEPGRLTDEEFALVKQHPVIGRRILEGVHGFADYLPDWTRGHTAIFVEVQRFVMPYTVTPTFRESAGYAEVRQVLSPRWFVAGRYGFTDNHHARRTNTFETATGFGPSRFQLLKFGYEFNPYGTDDEREDKIVGIQFIASLDKSAAWK